MEVKLKWGHDAVAFDLPDRNVIGVLEPEGGEPVADLWEATWDLLETPTAGEPFADIVERVAPKKIAIIVNDMTRSTPTQELLPPILKKLDLLDVARESVVIVVATGTHRAMTAEEIDRILGPDIPKTYRVVNHDCDAPDLVSLGTLSTGNELRICREVAEADMRIAIGEVLLHYYAGFAGGRKSILPGVAARETVMSNHKMMTRPGVDIGVVEGNPLSDEMIEAVERFCPLHFIVNCVSDSRKNIIRVVGGHWKDAWLEGIRTFREKNFAPLDRQADVVFVSAGGYPKDINMYQAHKAIHMASRAVRDGGTIVFFAELEEVYGHKTFHEWAQRGYTVDETIAAFEADFRFGAHKLYYLAKVAKRATILLYANVDAADATKMFCTKVTDLGAVVREMAEKYGPDFTSIVIPQGGIVLPVTN